LVTDPRDAIDVDGPLDLQLAEVILASRAHVR
jgi:hypothetical protein